MVDITAKTENFNMYFKMDSGKLGPSINKMISPEFPKSLGVIVGPGGSAESVTFYNDSGPARSNASWYPALIAARDFRFSYDQLYFGEGKSHS